MTPAPTIPAATPPAPPSEGAHQGADAHRGRLGLVPVQFSRASARAGVLLHHTRHEALMRAGAVQVRLADAARESAGHAQRHLSHTSENLERARMVVESHTRELAAPAILALAQVLALPVTALELDLDLEEGFEDEEFEGGFHPDALG